MQLQPAQTQPGPPQVPRSGLHAGLACARNGAIRAPKLKGPVWKPSPVILFLLLAVVASDFLARLVPRFLPFFIPRPLIQIALGALGALVGLDSRMFVPLDPQVFFVLLLPPLLFLDGWRIPPEELLRDKGTVVQLAFGLVVVTVLGAGLFIH